ncbi:ribosome assembly factor SBDS [Candidatus Woesearchaeota archaeon]|jgi:ribosome maturation protein SDO1|nr:ribosome assembly factor SBDS [Candidatus Woesearchaeota archaeon]MBT4114445.1 ribosome assembly factor SBDS [Candidatus Woesearchaeota archaeon]MBT4248235.1 ribosome assembly factor SBDS [Candidatus Woesearchaeota archaeon]
MQYQQTYAKEKLHLNIARLKKGGETFEVILDDIDKAIDLKAGKNIEVSDVMNGDLIFKNAHSAEKTTEGSMKQWLGTEDHRKAAEIIIKNGEIQLTAEQRKKILEQKTQQVLNYIHRNAAEPKTKLPLPMQRIELAMKQAGVHVDPTDRVEYQMEKIIEKLRPVLPMSFEHLKLRVVIPSAHAGRAYSAIKNKYKASGDLWRTDGSVQIELEVVAGERNDLYSLLNKLTNGEVSIEELK